MLTLARRALERLLEAIAMALMVILTVVVVVAVVYRFAGDSLSWYDEIASQLLAWLTYYGACLAALKRAHIGFDGLIIAVPIKWRLTFVVIAEACVFGFFAVLAWTGWVVLQVLEGDNLVSLPEVSVQITQSAIPITAVLFMICEAVSLPDYWRRVSAGVSHDEIEAAEAEEQARQ
ncbi:MAG: TRAP transporter small permease subunit [Pseudomonadota bacterium]